jgi:hypothetical protein
MNPTNHERPVMGLWKISIDAGHVDHVDAGTSRPNEYTSFLCRPLSRSPFVHAAAMTALSCKIPDLAPWSPLRPSHKSAALMRQDHLQPQSPFTLLSPICCNVRCTKLTPMVKHLSLVLKMLYIACREPDVHIRCMLLLSILLML